MSSRRSPFLTARWRQLAMLNYDVDPRVLAPHVPAGTELDDWNGRTWASMVGFLFLDTRVLGLAIPGHRDFEEVNLRFYVRRKAPEGWRRAVVFVKEIVPRRAIAWTARALYGENYVALPMSHAIDGGSEAETPRNVRYTWRFRGRENALELAAGGEPREADEGSDVQFITEHTWGYARRRDGRTTEYEVEHPRWRIRPATSCRLDCDVAGLYGEPFVEFLSGAPASAFLADGSVVTVYKGDVLAAGSVT
jgi:uncharacterized protein YqjF (DUF2071 family)